VHFPAHASPASLDPAIVHNLALVYLPTLLVLYAISIVAVRFYPISRATHEANLRAIAARAALAPAAPPPAKDGAADIPAAATRPVR